MPSGTTERDALIAALPVAADSQQEFADWAQSLVANSQLNADVIADIQDILAQITFT